MTTKTSAQRVAPQTLSADEVASYLFDHPDFFEQHAELLGELTISHGASGAVSLIERQVVVLREQNAQLKEQMARMVQVAHDNDRLNAQLHSLILALLDAKDTGTLFHLVENGLKDDLNIEHVVLKVFTAGDSADTANDGHFVAREDKVLERFGQFIKAHKPVCGRLNREQIDYLFGDGAPPVASAVLLPLMHDEVIGMLALGSSDQHRFHPGMATDFLVRMAQIISALLTRTV